MADLVTKVSNMQIKRNTCDEILNILDWPSHQSNSLGTPALSVNIKLIILHKSERAYVRCTVYIEYGIRRI